MGHKKKNMIHKKREKPIKRDRPVYNPDTAISKRKYDMCNKGCVGKMGR